LGSASISQSGSGRAQAAIRSHGFLDSISGINSHFTDSGLFGIAVEGAGSHSADLLKVALEQLDSLRQPINEVELARAKNAVKMDFLLAVEGASDRLEEVARNY
jgi:predicted Zn-dependent peptidase